MIKLSHNKKPCKKEAFSILLDSKYSAVPNQLSENDLDKLINYFAPPMPKIAKNVEQWVAKKEVREYLNYLYVKDYIIYGCDGPRIHWGKTAFKDGYYDPKTLLPIDFNGTYPDINCIINDNLDHCHSQNLNDSTTIFRDIHCYLLNDMNYQQLFINEAVNGNDSIVFHTPDDNSKIRGHSQFGEFVIMRIRDKN